MSREEAYALASIVGDCRVTQVVDIRKGVHCMIPKRGFVGYQQAAHKGSRRAARRCPIYLRRAQAMIEITALMSNIVVIGKKNLNPGRSMTISPGRRNSGRRLIQDQARPSKTRLAPRVMSRRFMDSDESTPSDRAIAVPRGFYRLNSPSIAPTTPPIADDSQS